MAPPAASRRTTPRTRRSLLVRLRDWQDQESWREFDQMYRRLILDTARRSGLDDPEAQEVVQDTLLSVAKRIAGFDYQPELGSFRGWLLQITRRRIVDQLRRRRPNQHQGTDSPPPEVVIAQLPDPSGARLEALWNEEWHQALLDMARSLVRRRVGDRQYRMFDLYVLQQLPMKTVTQTLQVNAAQVYMAKFRITRMLKKEIQSLEKATL